MKSIKKLSPFGLLMMAALTGCSSEEPVVVGPTDGVGEEETQYISVSLSNLNVPQTRAGKPDWDCMINSLTGYITKLDASGNETGVVEALAFPVNLPSTWSETIASGTDIEYNSSSKSYEVMLALGKKLTAGESYNLYLVANMEASMKMNLLNASNVKSLEVSYAGSDYENWDATAMAASKFLPMNSDEPIAITLADQAYPRTAPYYAGGAKGDDSRQSITLTRQFARLDYKTDQHNVYPISTTPENKEAKPLFSVRFYQMDVVNIADKEFLFTTNSSANGLSATAKTNTFLSPSGITAGKRQSFDLPLDAPICYIPENIPAYSALAANSGVTFQTATYLEFYGLLTATDVTPTDLKAAMTAHKDIYYYDDGTFQSLPRALADDEAEPSGNSWIKLEWKNVTIDGTATGGYLVKYRKAIRHNALDDTGAPATAANSDDLNADDGKVRAMEYAVRRNHVYQIGISAVRSLPRPVADTDLVETGKDALELQVKAPTAWTYHRQSAVVEVQ